MAVKCAIVLALILTTRSLLADPSIAVEADGITVTGATIGGKVALIGVERRSKNFMLTVHRIREFSANTDAAGRTRFLFPQRPAIQTLWAAVDLETGAFALATPQGMPLRRKELQPSALARDLTGKVIGIDVKADYLEVFLVRPRLGVWHTALDDGGPRDVDRSDNATVRISPSRLQSILGSIPLLSDFLPGDFLLAIEPLRMECIALQLPN